MENFNLKKFLVENKLTANSRMISENANEVEHRGYIIRPNEYNYGNKPGTKYEFYNTNDPDESMGHGSSVEDCKKQIDSEMINEDQESGPIQGINLVVLDDHEGGDITLEKFSDMDDEFQQIFTDGLEEGEWEATSLQQGLAELDEYFEERGDPSRQDEYNAKKQQFQSAVQGKAGKFYVHGIEYDLQLMFVEEQGM
jgi:hypothetical protein